MKLIVQTTILVLLLGVIVFTVLLPELIRGHFSNWLALEVAAVLVFNCWVLISVCWNREVLVQRFEKAGERFGRKKVIGGFFSAIPLGILAAVLLIRVIER